MSLAPMSSQWHLGRPHQAAQPARLLQPGCQHRLLPVRSFKHQHRAPMDKDQLADLISRAEGATMVIALDGRTSTAAGVRTAYLNHQEVQDQRWQNASLQQARVDTTNDAPLLWRMFIGVLTAPFALMWQVWKAFEYVMTAIFVLCWKLFELATVACCVLLSTAIVSTVIVYLSTYLALYLKQAA